NERQLQSVMSATSENPWQSFRAAVGKIILKSRLASSLPTPTAQESGLLAETWAEVLDGEVPMKDLDAAYLRAMRDKQGGFALTANDLVKAYRDNCESERVAPRQDSNLL